MTTRNPVSGKSGDRRKEATEPKRGLISLRSAVVFALAIIAGTGGTCLLVLGHVHLAIAVFLGFGVTAGAVAFFDRHIELVRQLRSLPTCSGSRDLDGTRRSGLVKHMKTTTPARWWP